MPSDPRTLVERADQARARGDRAQALRDLAQARALRGQQLGYSADGNDDGNVAYVSLAPEAAPVMLRSSPKVRVAEAGSRHRPSAENLVYAGSDLGQDAPDPLAAPPGYAAGTRPTSLAPSRTRVLNTAPGTTPQATNDLTADQLNARQLGASTALAPGAAPVYPDYSAPQSQQIAQAAMPAPAMAVDRRYQPPSQNLLPRYLAAGLPGPAGGGDIPTGEMPVEPDPLMQEIDRNIVALREGLSTSVQAGLGFRWNSGAQGLGRLVEATAPLEVVFSVGENGRVKLAATTTYLNSGTLHGNDINQQNFGTAALGVVPPSVSGGTYIPVAYAGAHQGRQYAQGVGLNAQYTNGEITGDIGSTPLGFKVQNVVGGVEYAPLLTDRTRLHLAVMRRAMTQSVLSYAGTTDPRTGATWGGVVEDRGQIAVDYSDGDLGLYASAGGGQLTGQHVANNSEYSVAASASYPVFRQGEHEVRLGLDLSYQHYDKNLGYFTYGQGGYFSPQRFFSAIVPVTYRARIGEDLTYEVSAGAGVQSFGQASSNYFPNDSLLQAQLVAASTYPGAATQYASKNVSGLAGNVRGKWDYRVTPNVHVGGQASYQHAGNYDETVATVYARYVFSGADKDK